MGKALAKDPDERYQHVDELLVDLRPLKRERESATIREAVAPARTSRAGWYVAGAVFAASLAAAAWFGLRGPATTAPGAPLTPVPLTSYQGEERHPTFSPDGNEVAFSWNGEAGTNSDIYRKLIGPGNPLPLTDNPADDYAPAWSPDGSSISRAISTMGVMMNNSSNLNSIIE